MKSIAVVLILSYLNSLLCEIIKIEDGKLEGTIIKTRKALDIHAFYKIPYAKPPVGNLRFQPPLRNDNWEGVRNAKTPGPICVQFDKYTISGIFGMSEDCLHLNVYTRNISSNNLRPVIIYLHSGGFENGAGIAQKPTYLLDREIFLVTVNYRLGPLGFLATGTKDATGNMGLKDQNLAFQWVQRNIEKFGGDSKSVTIAGLSAGGFSVTAHMVSPMSKGLFHKVIAVSGAITWKKGFKNHYLQTAQEVAMKLNCSTHQDDIVKCLQEKEAYDVQVAGLYKFHNCPIMPFLPVVELDFGQDRFLNDNPNKLFKEGNFEKVPILIGITADEFIEPVADILSNETLLNYLNNDFADFTSKCLFYGANNVRSVEEIGSILRKFYFQQDQIDARSFASLARLSADSTIGYDVHRLVHYASNYTDVYNYKFSYVGRYSTFYYPRNKPYGVHHIDDTQYIFEANFLSPQIKESDPENIMVERLTRIWEQFALKGNPNNSTDEYLSEMIWPKHDAVNEYYLDIGVHLIEKQGLYLDRYTVWNSLEVSSSGRISLFIGSFLALMLHLILANN